MKTRGECALSRTRVRESIPRTRSTRDSTNKNKDRVALSGRRGSEVDAAGIQSQSRFSRLVDLTASGNRSVC